MDASGAGIGPIDYLVVEFPPGGATGEGLPLLVDLVDRDVIRILDLVVVRKEADGSVTEAELTDLDGDGDLDLAVFTGARSGLLGGEDVADAGAILEPGATAAVLVYENRWAVPLVNAVHRGRGQMVASGRIPVADVIAALDAAEAAV